MDMIFSYLQNAVIALVAATVCATIALVALWKLVSDVLRSRSELACVWNKDPIQPPEGETRWICATCGAISFGQTGKPPAICRQHEPKPPG